MKNTTLVFKAGTWKGIKYTNEDLQDSVASYNKTKVSAPWVLGHEVYSGMPAAGWVRSLEYREDSNGVGEIVAYSDLNALGQKAIEDSSHENKSISFYPKESPYSPDPTVNFVRHVAMLGAEFPALHNLGPLAEVDFSEDLWEEELLTFSCSCQDEKTNPFTETFTMSEAEKINESILKLTEAIAKLVETKAEALSVEDEELVAEDKEDKEESYDGELDYKALYEAAQLELADQQVNAATVSRAQAIETFYSEGVLSEEVVASKDLILCLTKLEMGKTDFSETQRPEAVIDSLIAALKAAKPELGITLGEETDSSIDNSANDIELADESGTMSDDFAIAAEQVAVDHGLSFSQGMSVLLSANAHAKQTGVKLADAIKAEANRFKIH